MTSAEILLKYLNLFYTCLVYLDIKMLQQIKEFFPEKKFFVNKYFSVFFALDPYKRMKTELVSLF